MWRVVWRTAGVELFRRPAGAHRPKGLSALRDREHPVRWAWTSHADRHREGLALMARPGLAHTQILRFTRPAMARRWLCQIIFREPIGLPLAQTPTAGIVKKFGQYFSDREVERSFGLLPQR
jgi:hypothetical protein